jgi:hypothetical protein
MATNMTTAPATPGPTTQAPLNKSNATNDPNDNNSVLDISEQTQRPVDNAFNQQRINAWHPVLDPVFVIIGLFYLGVIMVPTGRLLVMSVLFSWLCLHFELNESLFCTG